MNIQQKMASLQSTIPDKVITQTSTAGFLNVGPGSNPPGVFPDATKGNVAGVLGFVGALIEAPQQTSSPPVTCGVFGQSGLVDLTGLTGPGEILVSASSSVTASSPAVGIAGVVGLGAEYGVLGVGPISGVQGVGTSNGAGVTGSSSTGGDGVSGFSNTGFAVHGTNGQGSAPNGPGGPGVWGDSENGIGVYGASKNSNAGEFDGNVAITGNHTVSGNADVGGSHTVKGNADVGGNHSVTGNANVKGNHTVTGKVTANDVSLAGSDCAEDFDIAGKMRLEPGTVVVFDDEGAISQTTQPYNKRVAGVISGGGKYRPGMILGRDGSSEASRAPVALMGRVYCKVDASYSPIQVGDMLTTSSTSGFAMKASVQAMAFGAVIGKALASLQEGLGLVPILVSLQ